MELRAKIIGVDEAFEGVVIAIQQEKMKLPIADELDCDEAIIARKMAKAMKGVGFHINFGEPLQSKGFRTGFWMSIDEYEQLGKPTIGDFIILVLKVEK